MNTPKINITDGQVYYEFSDGSSVKFASGEFEGRTCIEDFMEDGDFMKELYRMVLDVIEKQRPFRMSPLTEDRKKKLALHVFNEAYRVCSQSVEQNKNIYSITVNTTNLYYKDIFKDIVFSIAYTFLKLTKRFYDEDRYFKVMQIYGRIADFGLCQNFDRFVNRRGHAIDPICFGKIRRNIPKPEKAVKSDTMEDTLSRTLEGVNTLYNSLQEKEKQLNEAFGKVAILETLLAQHKEEIQELNHKLANQEPKIVEVIKEKVVEKKVPSGEGLNLETMTDYALTLQKDDEVQVIINFMNHLLVEDLYSGKGLKQLIKKLETHRRNLQKPVVSQVNTFQSGSTFNDIHDNDNAKINTNGRR